MSTYALVNKETNVVENLIELVDLDDVDRVSEDDLLAQGDYDPGPGYYLVKQTTDRSFNYGDVHTPD